MTGAAFRRHRVALTNSFTKRPGTRPGVNRLFSASLDLEYLRLGDRVASRTRSGGRAAQDGVGTLAAQLARQCVCARPCASRGVAVPARHARHPLPGAGKPKDVTFIAGTRVEDTLLVDDYEIYFHPGQEAQWIQIVQFQSPYPDPHLGRASVLKALEHRLL